MEKKKIYLREKSEVLGERYREKRENWVSEKKEINRYLNR